MTEPQLSAEQKKEWVVKSISKWMSESQEGMAIHVLSNYVNTELATALEEQRKKYLLAVEMLPETFEVENDGELLEVRKGVFDFKEEVLSILNRKE